VDPEELIQLRRWRQINPSLPPGLEDLAEAAAEVANFQKTLVEGLKEVKDAFELVRSALTTQLGNAQTQADTVTRVAREAVRLAISSVQAILNSFLDDLGAYVLLVPLPKKGLVAAYADATYPDQPGSNYVQFPDRAMLSLMRTTNADALRQSPSFASIFDAATFSLGGNRYLVNTIAGSIYDAGDLNRPKFTGESYWAYTLLVAGATDITSVMGALSSFDQLLSPPRSANELPASRNIGDFVTDGVRALPSGRNRQPVIEWTPVPPSAALTGYDGAEVYARQYAVIRSTGLEAKTATKVTQLFPTTDLREGLTGSFGAKVLKVADYNGVARRYVDSEQLTPGQTYYYHVLFNTTVTGSPLFSDSGQNNSPRNTTGVDPVERRDLPFGLLSNSAEWVHPKANIPNSNTQLSQAPDWYRTPSLARLLPGVDRVVDIVNEELQSAQENFSVVADRARDYGNFISQIVDNYSARADAVTSALTQAINVLENINAGIYGTVRYGQGPASSFIADVVGAIDDVNDVNRPPFDAGDEYVVAALVVVVSPDAAVIQGALDFLKLLTGLLDDDVVAGINSITTTLATAEQALVDQITGGGESPADAPVAFSEDMTPRPLGQPDASCG
jgi:hypothetical protein